MSIKDIFKKSFLEGFISNDLSANKIIAIMVITLLLSLYLYYVYSFVNKKSLYNKEYHITMSCISLVTAAIVIAIQSNIVVSLGMVGALSIVRFRTAIKSPIDLFFLFWSISNGIICGTGLFNVAAIEVGIITIGVLLFNYLPETRNTYILIVNASAQIDDELLNKTIKNNSKYYKLKSKNVKKNNIDYIFEIIVNKESNFSDVLNSIPHIEEFSLMSQDGELRI